MMVEGKFHARSVDLIHFQLRELSPGGGMQLDSSAVTGKLGAQIPITYWEPSQTVIGGGGEEVSGWPNFRWHCM